MELFFTRNEEMWVRFPHEAPICHLWLGVQFPNAPTNGALWAETRPTVTRFASVSGSIPESGSILNRWFILIVMTENETKNVFLNNDHCPKCRGPLHQKKPSNDNYLIVEKESVIRFWCPCGYYRDEVIKKIK